MPSTPDLGNSSVPSECPIFDGLRSTPCLPPTGCISSSARGATALRGTADRSRVLAALRLALGYRPLLHSADRAVRCLSRASSHPPAQTTRHRPRTPTRATRGPAAGLNVRTHPSRIPRSTRRLRSAPLEGRSPLAHRGPRGPIPALSGLHPRSWEQPSRPAFPSVRWRRRTD